VERKPQITLAGLLLIVVAASVMLALFLPMRWNARREFNERNASSRLKTLTQAEADFRSNDRDGNSVNDFWTADVYGLYGIMHFTAGSAGIRPHEDSADATLAIPLIEPSVAAADGLSRTGDYYNVTFAALGISGSANHGYVFRALASQDDGAGATTLLNDTDGVDFGGSVHDRSRFAFMAFPTSLDEGRFIYIVNADNTIWKYTLPGTYRATYRPLAPGDSSSRVSGTGTPNCLDVSDTPSGVFPSSPGSTGVTKID
jgi:hypothetical protein